MLQSKLLDLTLEQGAELTACDDWQMPAHYGDPAAEYTTAHQGAVLRDASHLSRIHITGADHLSFLHRMSTNHFEALGNGSGIEAVFPDSRGRIFEFGAFYHRNEATLAVLSPPARHTLPAWLDRYIFAEKIVLQDITEESAMLELCGPQAAAITSSVLENDLGLVTNHHLLDHSAADIWCMRLDRGGHPGLRLAGALETLRDVWKKLRDAGAVPCGEQTWETLRVEAGLPAHNRELTEDHNPWEAGLDATIHMDKGCYIGQEVIARLDTYDKVKQHLTGLYLPADVFPQLGTQLMAEQRDVGKITSVVHSPRLNRNIALAYVRNAFSTAGTALQFCLDDTTHTAEVVALPFA